MAETELSSNADLALLYQGAIKALVGGAQSYKVGDTEVTRADLGQLERQYKYYRDKALQEQAGGIGPKAVRMVPKFSGEGKRRR